MKTVSDKKALQLKSFATRIVTALGTNYLDAGSSASTIEEVGANLSEADRSRLADVLECLVIRHNSKLQARIDELESMATSQGETIGELYQALDSK